MKILVNKILTVCLNLGSEDINSDEHRESPTRVALRILKILRINHVIELFKQIVSIQINILLYDVIILNLVTSKIMQKLVRAKTSHNIPPVTLE